MSRIELSVEYKDQEGRHTELVPLQQYGKWLIKKLFKGKIEIISTECVGE